MNNILYGASVRDITPAFPVTLEGYGGRNRKAGEAPTDYPSERLSLGVLALGNRDKRILIVTLDVIGVASHVASQLSKLVEEETGIGFPDVVISASHTHFAPTLHEGTFDSPEIGLIGPDERFIEDVRSKLAECARESLSCMRHGELETYRTSAPSILYNRRTLGADGKVVMNLLYPENPRQYTFSPTDPELTVLRIRDGNKVKAVLLNFGCHPVTGGKDPVLSGYNISSDYPYYVRETIAEEYSCPVFFTLGAAGDAVSMNRYGNSRQQIGRALGSMALLGERAFAPASEGDSLCEIRTAVEKLGVKTIIQTSGTNAEKNYKESRSRLLNTPPEAEDYRAAQKDFLRKSTRYYRSRLYPDDSYTIQVQFVRVGGTVLVGLPFEVLSEFSVKMKQRFPQSLLLSVTNGYQGYFPFAHEYERGGYEATPESTHFEEGTADKVLDLVIRRLQGF